MELAELLPNCSIARSLFAIFSGQLDLVAIMQQPHLEESK
jgi:hypothetical protein